MVEPTFAAEPQHDIIALQRLIGNQGVQKLLRQQAAPSVPAAAAPTPAPVPHIQRFGTDEHRVLGDEATKGEQGQVQTVRLAEDYRISYGEMVAMAGDYFASIDQMRQLAANPGTGAGTREEVEYVRVVKVNKGADTFSPDAKAAVDRRYYDLAMNNRSHFLNPEAGDSGRTPEDKADDAHTEWRIQWANLIPGLLSLPTGVTDEWVLPSAGAAYRRYHVRALEEAYQAGVRKATIDDAMAVEAFGNHYLTDSFAGGHVRTPRASINEHWNTRVPMFNYNIKGYIAEQVAKKLSASGNLSADAYYHWGALSKVTNAIDAKGFITFGDVISGAIHDYDNARGVMVTIGVDGQDARLFGDGNLGKGDEKDYAMMAIGASHRDIVQAYEAGKQGTLPLALIAQLMHGEMLFNAETLLPQVKPDSAVEDKDKSIKWDYNSADELLGDSGFVEALKLFAKDKASEFEGVAGGFEEAQKKALTEAVVEPLRNDPAAVMRAVINWTPNTGGGMFGHNQDDNALDYYEAAKAKDALGTLTITQKVAIIRNLIDGATMGDEEDAIFALVNANPAEADAVIRQVGWSELEDEVGERFSKKYPKANYH